MNGKNLKLREQLIRKFVKRSMRRLATRRQYRDRAPHEAFDVSYLPSNTPRKERDRYEKI